MKDINKEQDNTKRKDTETDKQSVSAIQGIMLHSPLSSMGRKFLNDCCLRSFQNCEFFKKN